MSYAGNIDTDGVTHLIGSTLLGSCSTLAATADKVVSLADFDALLPGVTVQVKFLYSNTAASPTLNVNNTGAKPIYVRGVESPGTTAATSWDANSVVSFTYDGTNWMMNDANVALTEIVGDGVLTGFTATNLTGAANELKGETTEVKNTLTQLDSDLDDEIAIRQTYVRPNLLDNWYFMYGKEINNNYSNVGTFPVNQRGLQTYSDNNENLTCDRWCAGNHSSVTIESDGVRLIAPGGSGLGSYILWQHIENGAALLKGKTVTLSAVVKSLSSSFYFAIRWGTGSDWSGSYNICNSTGLFQKTISIPSTASGVQIVIATVTDGGTMNTKIEAIKLEIGEGQTLAHYDNNSQGWVLNEIPNYSEQLYRCIASTVQADDSYANKPYSDVVKTLGEHTLGGNVKYRRSGNVVTVVAENDATSVAGSGELVGTLPVGYRPPFSMRVINQEATAYLYFGTDGEVKKIARTQGTTGYLVGTTATYFTTEAMPNS